MSKKDKLEVRRMRDGFIVGEPQNYDMPKDAKFCPSFEDAIMELAVQMGEDGFASTVKQASAMASAIADITNISLAPKLLAISAKLNPGSENVVDLGE